MLLVIGINCVELMFMGTVNGDLKPLWAPCINQHCDFCKRGPGMLRGQGLCISVLIFLSRLFTLASCGHVIALALIFFFWQCLDVLFENLIFWFMIQMISNMLFKVRRKLNSLWGHRVNSSLQYIHDLMLQLNQLYNNYSLLSIYLHPDSAVDYCPIA